MTTTHVPMTVTAELSVGISASTPWGIALDGLLASQLWYAQKDDLAAGGTFPPRLHEQVDPPDLELPLKRCHDHASGLWHWAATCSWPVNQPTGLGPDVRYWAAHLDQRTVGNLAATVPATVSQRRGRYRSRRIPTLATVCTAVSWHAVGDVDRVAELLHPLAAIGKRRGTGEGHVRAWHITPAPELDAEAAAHLHPDETLGRPSPAGCVPPGLRHTTTVGTAGLRPPYMHRSRQHQLHLPPPVDQEVS